MAYIGKKPTDVPLTSADIADEIIDSDAYVDGSIDNAHIADDAIDSEHYADGSIDNAHIADDAIDSEHYADGSIDNAHIADDAIDSEHYTDGSIDNAHIADDAIDSEHYADGSIDEAHIANNAVTLAKMAGGTDGQIITFDASGDPVAVGPGSDGEVLTSTGAGSPPAFEAAAGGGNLVFIDEVNISSTVGSADFLTSFSSTYDDYICYFDNFQVSTDTALGAVRIAIAGAAKTDSSYAYGTASFTEAFGTSNGASTATTHFRLSAGAWGASATETGAGWASFHGVNAAVQKFINTHTSLLDYNSAYLGSYGGCAYQGATTAWSGFQFLSSGGNMKLGNFKLYGIKNS